jgi:hypothetical protein
MISLLVVLAGYYLMAKYERSGMYGSVSSPYLESDTRICLSFWYNLYVSIASSSVRLSDKTLNDRLVEVSGTRGTTALVYCLINSSLYTGTYCTRVVEYTPIGLTVSRGVASSPQGSPRALASAGRRRGQRSNLRGGVR